MCVCMVYLAASISFLLVSCNCSVSGTPNATANDDLDPSTLATHSSLSLVPRPWTFVACSVKFTQNYVLQVTNVQGLGTRLLQLALWKLQVAIFKTVVHPKLKQVWQSVLSTNLEDGV